MGTGWGASSHGDKHHVWLSLSGALEGVKSEFGARRCHLDNLRMADAVPHLPLRVGTILLTHPVEIRGLASRAKIIIRNCQGTAQSGRDYEDECRPANTGRTKRISH